jgi:hypothetical protein
LSPLPWEWPGTYISPSIIRKSGENKWNNKKPSKKLSIELHLPWTQLLPLAVAHVRATPHSPSFLSPFEIMYGLPFLLGNLPPTDPAPLADYLPYLNLLQELLREHADQILPHPTEGPITTSFKPGDLVLLKDL